MPRQSVEALAGRAPLVAGGRSDLFRPAGTRHRELRFDVAQAGSTGWRPWGACKQRSRSARRLRPNLGAGENNGPGHNGLVTTYLAPDPIAPPSPAEESAGSARLLGGARDIDRDAKTHRRGQRAGDARARQGGERPAGNHARRPLHDRSSGRRPPLAARLEDFEGWPLGKPGETRLLTRQFEKGSYRLVVSPEDVEARMAARLRRFTRRRILLATDRIPCRSRRRRSCNGANVGARRARPRYLALLAAGRRGCRAVDHRRHDGRDFTRRQGERRQGGGRARFSRAGLAPATIAWRRARSPATTGSTMNFAENPRSCSPASRVRRLAGEGSPFRWRGTRSSI